MKAAVIPALNATWELRDIPTPKAEPGQVLIKVHATGICFTDIWTTRGAAGDVFPNTPGHEVVGEVVEVGEGVRTRRVGDRVGTTWVQSTCGRCAYCKENLPLSGQAAVNCPDARLTGFTVQGGHAEYIAVPATGTVLIPDGLSYEEAAPIFCAGYTTWSGLRAAEPEPGERIAVLGIGGLGHLALQFAKAAGHETIAVTHSPDKRDLARELGADLVVADGAELQAAGGADVLLLCSNSYDAGRAAMQGLRHDGRAVLLGLDPFAEFTIPNTAQPFFAQRQKFIGATHNGLNYLTEALDLAASGKVTPMIETFPKERIVEAVTKVTDGNVRFRAVITY
ncbi:alcohol dehydrogenase catalytic domain-containing protein [Kitasatospora sp. YST-16]|uniref:alcohol dehydrogenase catalytic domain-containing protein n=1 Tax=Kitasatospora sp. YST-16 TaxID=2998080 RepID=UPI002283F130|nr:alcohol dehydrogenase catalytic domain-containing protein [Kitasatospora sp. YST-16]WAL75784.1 alcohol dehydrogenase catalytic domain-containing protein [Kitasatospora sp. YST-16]WNW41852.1 alcohol dehydrogenase catalytic domain-containing protein [Streptomyces sp. Li-HN-5-13]